MSKYPLQKEVEDRMYEVFMESIAAATTTTAVKKFVDDLLSPTERLMIAKRLSIALLLVKQYDQRTISRWLKVSLGTVSKVSLVLQKKGGGYTDVIGAILVKDKIQVVLQKIDDALAELFAPRNSDMRTWRRRRWEAKVAGRKAF